MSDHPNHPMATLRLAANDLDPQIVTNILDRTPQVAARKGERLYSSSRWQAVAKTGTWFFTTENSSAVTPSDHLDQVITLLAPHVGKLRTIIPDLKVNLSLFAYRSEPLDISDELQTRAKKLGTFEIEIAD